VNFPQRGAQSPHHCDVPNTYQDVFLTPQYTIVKSRQECSTKVRLGSHTFAMPVYAANMKSVVDENTCKYFAEQNWFYTMHRFGVDSVKFTRDMQSRGLIASVSVGVKDDGNEVKRFISSGIAPEFITLDIANAYSVSAEPIIKMIKDHLPNSFLIVGNVATSEAVSKLEEWGASAIKIGIGGGLACTTKNKTGFHRPMVPTILDCASVATVPLIADGGIRDHGDIAKAIACGATMVMAGSLFAGYDQSAGKLVSTNNTLFKEYFGSASEHNKGQYTNVEGKMLLVEYKGSMDHLLRELTEDLQSSISYAGGKDLSALHRGLLQFIR